MLQLEVCARSRHRPRGGRQAAVARSRCGLAPNLVVTKHRNAGRPGDGPDRVVALPPNSDIDDTRAKRIAVCGAESAESVEVGARQTSEVAETSFMKNAVSAEFPS
jgi:hypothetical protein